MLVRSLKNPSLATLLWILVVAAFGAAAAMMAFDLRSKILVLAILLVIGSQQLGYGVYRVIKRPDERFERRTGRRGLGHLLSAGTDLVPTRLADVFGGFLQIFVGGFMLLVVMSEL